MAELLDADEAAARCWTPGREGGIKRSSLIHSASATNRKPAAERTIYDCPLPVKHEPRPRKSPGVKGPRMVNTPLWDAAQIQAWREALAGRPAPDRERDDAGRYLSRDLA